MTITAGDTTAPPRPSIIRAARSATTFGGASAAKAAKARSEKARAANRFNAVLIVAGDLDPKQFDMWIDRYLGVWVW
ncbi:MAG TPA: hypothetical protein VHY33_04435 [Thermoanaerobaculia bacterium]|nr:hypothetical protein [Thermoanaerobaculia bacterium]